MNRLAGDQQDDQVALHLAEVNTAREERAALDAQADGVVQQVDVQRFLHQLHGVSRGGPEGRDRSEHGEGGGKPARARGRPRCGGGALEQALARRGEPWSRPRRGGERGTPPAPLCT